MPSGIAVIEIEVPNHRRIDESCRFGRQLVTETKNTAGILAGELTVCQPPADLRRLAVIVPERTAQGIDEPLPRGMHAIIVQIAEGRSTGIFRYLVSDLIHVMVPVADAMTETLGLSPSILSGRQISRQLCG